MISIDRFNEFDAKRRQAQTVNSAFDDVDEQIEKIRNQIQTFGFVDTDYIYQYPYSAFKEIKAELAKKVQHMKKYAGPITYETSELFIQYKQLKAYLPKWAVEKKVRTKQDYLKELRLKLAWQEFLPYYLSDTECPERIRKLWR